MKARGHGCHSLMPASIQGTRKHNSDLSSGLAVTAVQAVKWVALEKWVSRCLNLLVFVVLGRLLAPGDFGTVAIATVFVGVLLVLSDAGLSKAIIQRAAVQRDHLDACFWWCVALSIVLLGLVYISAPIVSDIYDAPELCGVLRTLAVVLPIEAFCVVPSAVMEREFRFKTLALRRIGAVTAGSIVGIGCVFLGLGLWSLVYQTLTASAVGAVLLWTLTPWRPRLRFSVRSLSELWHVGWHIATIEVIAYVNAEADKLLIGAVAGTDALGYYFVGSRIVMLLIELQTAVLSQVSLPVFSRLQGDRPRALSAFYRIAAVSCTLSSPVYLVCASLAPIVVPFLFGEQWISAVVVTQVLCMLGIINSVVFFDRNFLVGIGESGSALFMTTAQAVGGLVLLFGLAPFGIVWVAIGVVARQLLFWPLRLYVLRSRGSLDVALYFKRILPGMAAAAFAFAVGSIVWDPVLRHIGASAAQIDLSGSVVIVVVYILFSLLLNRATFRDTFVLARGKV